MSNVSLISLLVKEYANRIASPAIPLLTSALNALRAVAPDSLRDRELTAMYLNEALGLPYATALLQIGPPKDDQEADGKKTVITVRGNLMLTAAGTLGLFSGNEFVLDDVTGKTVYEISADDFFVDCAESDIDVAKLQTRYAIVSHEVHAHLAHYFK